jgi:hypothetical protein
MARTGEGKDRDWTTVVERLGEGEALRRLSTVVGNEMHENLPKGVGFIVVLTSLDEPDRVYVSNLKKEKVMEIIEGMLIAHGTRSEDALKD